jgi:hypothetical protein
MTDHANRLWELLGELGARPGTMECDDDENVVSAGTWEPVEESIALAILRDESRRVLDAAFIRIDWAVESRGQIVLWAVVGSDDEMIADCVESYESALIAGLEHIVEQRGDGK